MYYNYDFGCINSSTGYHYVPIMNNHSDIIVSNSFAEVTYPGESGVFACDWWGNSTITHWAVGCLNSPNYYLQQELSLWC